MENSEALSLHVVIFDVPYPPDYGGAMDVYYRLKALCDAGFNLVLHVFEYGRGRPHQLETLGKVNYYVRKKSIRYLFNFRPFIVVSRRNIDLLNRLKQDKIPILFEGIHTTWYLEDPVIRQRFTMVRTHNIEHDYYRGLIGNAPILKRLFFWWESIKLKKYEPILRHATWLLAIKPSDATHFKSFNQQTIVIPAVLPLESTIAKREKTEPFVLFHGNLSVIENELGARWIIRALDELLTVDFPLVIAGKNPSQELIRCADGKRIKIFANPDESEMQNLIAGARVHALYSDVGSGTKLKFLSSLSANGHVLVNTAVAGDIPKNEFFHIADDAVSFARIFSTIYNKKLSALQIAKRREWLQSVFGAKNTVQKISDLFSDEKMRDHH